MCSLGPDRPAEAGIARRRVLELGPQSLENLGLAPAAKEQLGGGVDPRIRVFEVQDPGPGDDRRLDRIGECGLAHLRPGQQNRLALDGIDVRLR